VSDAPATCVSIATDVRRHRHTAREVVDAALAAAERHQERYRAFIQITPEIARRQAEEVDVRLARGDDLPLAGVPFAVKDLFDVAGTATTYGSPVFRDRIARSDAEAVRRLTAAGAVLVGKLNLHECAFGFTGENPHFGDCRNPWDPDRIAGGSSSGSAVAVALGIVPLALGSDTGGSIRQPSALCGLVGLKPTYGRVSRVGGLPLSWTMDHVGLMVRTAEDAALVLGVLAGRDPRDESTSERPVPDFRADLQTPIEGLQVGIPRSWFYDALEPPVEAALEAARRSLVDRGARTVEMELPLLEEALGAHRAIIFSEASSWHRPILVERAGEYVEGIRSLLLAGLFLPAGHYLKALRARRIIRRAWAAQMAKVDLLLTPATPVTATRFGQQSVTLAGQDKPLVRAYLDVTLPFNLSGHPAISVPCGFSPEGLPIGMQFVGRPFEEGTILRVAHHYQQATDWHRRTP
jgi:aspartyl-tRNA(Asn)/glutamyl-tRNA(Gln) amidotransferase subunit A